MMNKEIADCGAAAGGGGIRLPENIFRSRDGVRGSGPPAFLTKTFSIVNDPNTNSIISWSLMGNSFIIWDHLQFSAEILPKYFKHSNLSSFIYQLNNYGFRKIGVDHEWEYENPNFQSGKIHLLTNIKRRNQNPQRVIRPRPKRTFTNINPKFLRNVNQELKQKIEKLKKQQEEMEFRIMKFEEEVKRIENKSRKLMIYTVKLCDEILFEKIKDENIEETLMEDHEELVKEDLNQLCENRPVWSSDDCEPGLEKKSSDDCEWGLGKNSGDFMFWKKILLEDDEVEVGIEMGKEQAKIALDLEGLISKLD